MSSKIHHLTIITALLLTSVTSIAASNPKPNIHHVPIFITSTSTPTTITTITTPPPTAASTTANTTSTKSPTLPCYNFADPDNNVGDYCMCSNGISTPIAPATGTNTGIYYQPCPYTVAPTVQVASIWTPSGTVATASSSSSFSSVVLASSSCTDEW